MSVNALNNLIGSQKLTNQAYMITPLSAVSTENKTNTPAVSAETEHLQHKNTEESGKKKHPANAASKYLVGACAIAASVIAGIYIYRGKGVKDAASNTQETVQNLEQSVVVKKVTNFIKSLEEKVPDFDIEKSALSVYNNGIERIDRVLDDSLINISEFFDNSKKLFARLNWNDENKIASGFHFNNEGQKITDLQKTAEYIFKRLEEPPVS